MPRKSKKGAVPPDLDPKSPEVAEDPVVRAFETVAGGAEKLTAFDLRIRLFLFYYLQTFSGKRAAEKMGVTPLNAASVGSKYLNHLKTQKLLKETLRDADEEIEILRREVLFMAVREANHDDMCPGSQGARVNAIRALMKALGMEQNAVTVKQEGPPGVLVVPMATTAEEWADQARASQDLIVNGDPEHQEEEQHFVEQSGDGALTHEGADDSEDPLGVL